MTTIIIAVLLLTVIVAALTSALWLQNKEIERINHIVSVLVSDFLKDRS